jgi:hypothetical protein
MYRTGITSALPTGTAWQTVNGALVDISVTPVGNVWGVNAANQIWFGAKTSDPATITWTNIGGALVQISVGTNGAVWGVNSGNNIYYRTGITTSTPMGSGWQQAAGVLKHVAVAPSGNIWGINLTGQPTFSLAPTVAGQTTWTVVDGSVPPLKQMSVSPNGDVWAIATDGSLYNRTGVTTTAPQGTGWQLYNGKFLTLSCGYKATEQFTLTNIAQNNNFKNFIILLIILLIIYSIYHYIYKKN